MRAWIEKPWLLFLIAVLARLLFSQVAMDVQTWEDVDRGGELGQIAKNISEGRGFSDPFGDGTAPTAWFSPLVPLLWSGVFSLTGAVFSPASLHLLLLLQAVLGAFVVLGMVQILRRAGVRHTAWAGLAFALWPETLKLHAFPWYFVFQDLGMVAMVLVGIAWIQRGGCTRALFLGLVSGLTLLVNPIPLLLLALLLGGGIWKRRGLPTLAQALLVVLLTAAILAPWAARNAWRLGKAQPFRGNFGVELRQGNAEEATLAQMASSRHPALQASERARYYAQGEAGYEASCRREALRYMQEHPWKTLQRTVVRVRLFWLTDFLDEYPWQPRPKWWTLGPKAMAERVLLSGAALSLVLAALLLLVRGRLLSSPFAWLWLGVVVLVPAPYYLTHVVALYPLTFKPYLLLWVLAAWGSRPTGRQP